MRDYSKLPVKVKSLSLVRLFVTPCTVAHQAPPSMGFSRQEYWSGLPFPSPGDLPTQGLNPGLPHRRQTLYSLSHQGNPKLPDGSDCKASAYNAGEPGSIPGSERSLGEGNGNPLQYSCLLPPPHPKTRAQRKLPAACSKELQESYEIGAGVWAGHALRVDIY